MSDFDDLFKSRFEGHEVDVPDDMWSRIQDAQAPEDVRKPIFLYWKIGIASIILLALISVPFLFSQESKIEVVSSESTNQIQELPLSGKIKSTGSISNGLLLAREELSSASNEVKTTNNTSAEILNSIHKQEDRNYTFKENPTTYSSESLPVELTVSNPINVSESKVSSVLSNDVVYDFIKREIKPTQNLNTLELVPLTEKLLFTSELLPDYAKKCPKFGNSVHGYFSVEAYHSSDYNLKRFTSADEEFNSYINLRNETENTVYSYSNGIRFKWHNNSGLGLGLGLERSVIKETFSFVEQDAREVKVLISIDTLFNTDGTFTTSTDTTRIEIAGVRTNRINNSYTSIDLPLHLSYQMEFGRWAVGLSGGIYINLMFDQKGRILNFDNKPAWITSGSDNELDIYRPKSGLKFDGAISLIYHLTPSIDIMTEPYFKYNPNSLTRENHPLKHYNNTLGIRAGLRYNFGF